MRTYNNKEELKAEINKAFEKYISEFDDIPEALKDKRVEEVDRTPAENLAYQVGWTTLVLKWETDERNGLPVKTPSEDFKWNQLGGLYQWFTDTYAPLSLQELKARLKENMDRLNAMIDAMSEEELYSLEYDLFCEVRERIAAEVVRIQNTAKAVAMIDVYASLSVVATQNNFVRPKINEKGIIDIKNGQQGNVWV